MSSGEAFVVEYRRGVASSTKNRLWHFHPDCGSYPIRTFAIRKDEPSDEELCAKCAGLASDMPKRSAA